MVAPWMFWSVWLLVVAQRLGELMLARRNARRSLAHGGREYGAGHFWWIVVVMVGFFIALPIEYYARGMPFSRVWLLWLALALGAQILRYAAIITLGVCWNVRIIVTPGAPRVTTGIYRWLRHPNYIAVAAELIALPMLVECRWTALGALLGFFIFLRIRIPAEEAALRSTRNHIMRILCCVLGLIGLLMSTAFAAAGTYRVMKVVDGDTFDATDGTIRFRVRIAGMDAPEKGSPFSKVTTYSLQQAILDKSVTLQPVGKGIDLYNRILAQVIVGGQDIGAQLIEQGLATYYRPGCVDYPLNQNKYDYDPRVYVAAESKARSAKRQIWSDKTFVLPCEVRRTEKVKR